MKRLYLWILFGQVAFSGIRAQDKNLQEILQFGDAGNGKTKITSSMVG